MTLNRRTFVQGVSAAAALSASKLALAADTLKIGYVSPQTGPLAPFGEADKWVIDQMKAAFKDGLSIGGKKYGVQIILKDSQSNPNRAGEVANDLILKDKVALMLTAGTPETANPVCDACELNEVSCISSVVPWQPWFFGRKGDPAKGFNYTYHIFWGLEDVIATFTSGWNSVKTNKKVGGLFPNDGDGNAWGDPNVGFPPVLSAQGYTLTDPGRYQNLSDDFSSQINAFKAANVEIVTGVVIPPDFTTFWTQAKQQGFTPKAASIGKAILFPQAVDALGDTGHNLSSEVWWSPSHPFASSLSGQSAGDLAAGYSAATGRPWTQPIGFVHALFEMAADVLGRVSDAGDGDAVAEAIAATNLNTIVGPIAFNGAGLPPFAVKNVAKTPLVGGQWRLKDGGGYDLVIVDNKTAPNVPTGGTMEAIV